MLLRVSVLTAILAAGALAADDPNAPLLTDARFQTITDVLKADRDKLDLEQEEIRYQQAVSQQTISDLAKIYDPKYEDKVRTAYVSFTPETSVKPGDDKGYGLHIVKRLDLPLVGGETRTIYVNEQWSEDKHSKGILLPDEIRIQSQVAGGKRRVKGSEKLYVFDSVRIAWGPYNANPILARRTIYQRVNGRNEFKQTRTSVSAPFSCTVCHESGNKFADAFLASKEERNNEAIVQDSHFGLPPQEMRGFKQYIAHLQSSKADPAFIEKVKTSMSNIRQASAVPGLFDVVVEATQGGIEWLAGDPAVRDQNVDLISRNQGVYRDYAGRWRLDAVQELIEGKYTWWEPIAVIP